MKNKKKLKHKYIFFNENEQTHDMPNVCVIAICVLHLAFVQ